MTAPLPHIVSSKSFLFLEEWVEVEAEMDKVWMGGGKGVGSGEGAAGLW